jgi:uncharacterized protein (TIGR02231 family)
MTKKSSRSFTFDPLSVLKDIMNPEGLVSIFKIINDMNKKIIIIAAIFLISLSANAQAKEYASNLERVKIYTSGAEVFRNVKVSVKAGTSEVILDELSNQIDANSIIVGITDGFTVMGTQFKTNYRYAYESDIPAIKKLTDSVVYYNKQYQLVQNKKSVVNNEADLLRQNRNIGGTNGTSTENLEKAIAFFNKRFTYILAEQNKLDEDLTEIRNHQRRINTQIAELRKLYPTPPNGQIVVQVSAEKAGNATINFSYLTRGAGWFSLYEARCSELSKPIQLIHKASVRQNTGEVWDNIKLELSSGNPNVGVNVPNLYPRYLSFYNYSSPKPGYSNRAQNAPALANKGLYLDESEAETAYEEPENDGFNGITKKDKRSTVADYTTSTSNEVAIEYVIDRPYTIMSGNQQQLITLKSYEIEAIYNYYTIPKIDKSVYLTARLVNWQQYNLLQGQVNLFYKNSFVGKTDFVPSALNDTLRLSLGKDPKVIVERTNQRDYTKVKNIGSNKKETLGYTISINNTNSTPIEIEVLDQIPLSKHSDIEVEIIKKEGGAFDDKTGELKWILNVKGGKATKLEVEYEVTSPKNKPVYGL